MAPTSKKKGKKKDGNANDFGSKALTTASRTTPGHFNFTPGPFLYNVLHHSTSPGSSTVAAGSSTPAPGPDVQRSVWLINNLVSSPPGATPTPTPSAMASAPSSTTPDTRAATSALSEIPPAPTTQKSPTSKRVRKPSQKALAQMETSQAASNPKSKGIGHSPEERNMGEISQRGKRMGKAVGKVNGKAFEKGATSPPSTSAPTSIVGSTPSTTKSTPKITLKLRTKTGMDISPELAEHQGLRKGKDTSTPAPHLGKNFVVQPSQAAAATREWYEEDEDDDIDLRKITDQSKKETALKKIIVEKKSLHKKTRAEVDAELMPPPPPSTRKKSAQSQLQILHSDEQDEYVVHDSSRAAPATKNTPNAQAEIVEEEDEFANESVYDGTVFTPSMKIPTKDIDYQIDNTWYTLSPSMKLILVAELGSFPSSTSKEMTSEGALSYLSLDNTERRDYLNILVHEMRREREEERLLVVMQLRKDQWKLGRHALTKVHTEWGKIERETWRAIRKLGVEMGKDVSAKEVQDGKRFFRQRIRGCAQLRRSERLLDNWVGGGVEGGVEGPWGEGARERHEEWLVEEGLVEVVGDGDENVDQQT